MSGDGPDGGTVVVTIAAIGAAAARIFGAGAPGNVFSGLGGALTAQARAQTAGYLSQAFYQRQAQALHAFEQQTPGGVGELITQPAIDPKAQQLAEALVKIKGLIAAGRSGKRLAGKEAKLEKKLAKRELLISPQAEVRVANLYGPNAGYWREYGAPAPLWLTQRSH